MRIVMMVVTSLLLTAPALASEPVDRSTEIVCKGDRTKSLGSNLAAKKVCRSRAEWAAISANSRRVLQGMSERGLNPTPIPGAR